MGMAFSVDHEIPRREAVLIPAVIGVGQPHHDVICLQVPLLTSPHHLNDSYFGVFSLKEKR